MARLQAVNPQEAQGKTKELFQMLEKKLGRVPNMLRTLGNSAAALESYVSFSSALSHGVLSAKVREQIALAVGEVNQCTYCVAAHSAIGKHAGLSDSEISDARRVESSDPKVSAMLRFARSLVERRGHVSADEVAALKGKGLGEDEIAEVVANVGLNVFTNYFNHVADPEIDFPKVG